jgi:hypothetical protein
MGLYRCILRFQRFLKETVASNQQNRGIRQERSLNCNPDSFFLR